MSGATEGLARSVHTRLIWDSIGVRDIREGDDYGGKRITFTGFLGAGRIPIQVDVGIGDVVDPEPEEMEYPVILDFPQPMLKVYPPEVVVAEKLQAMVQLGPVNTRMKDFFDIYVLSETHRFRGDRLRSAILATFERRGTTLPNGLPLALTPQFATEEKDRQWEAFLKKGALEAPEEISSVIQHLALFLGPIIRDLSPAHEHWPAGGPWGDEEEG